MICVLQFDSASVAVMERLLAQGRLPNLAALRARGRHHELDTPAADFAAGAFYTLYSGVELADHGVFYPFQWSADRQRARYSTAFEAPPAVWERLAAAGRRSLVIDPYEGRPPERALGTFVSGWGFSDRAVLRRWSRPRRAALNYGRRFGRGPSATEVFGQPRAAELLRLRERLIAAPERVAKLARHLLATERFDLAWITLAASHLAGHQFWDLSQIDPASLDAESAAILERALDDVYIAVDRAIGEIVESLPNGADVIVTSAVGMDENTSRADLLPGMLAAVLAGGPLEGDDSGGSIWRLRATVPPRLRAAAGSAIPDRLALELTARLELRGIHWQSTEAFAHPADNQGYIRLNLRGREREGIVPYAEAEELAARISEGLASFTDPDGTPAVDSVVNVAEQYPGALASRLPDLVVRWSSRPANSITHLESPRFGRIERWGTGSGRSGNHTPGDAWALVSPGESRLSTPSRPPRLVDVAATVCEATAASRDGLPGEPLLEA